MAAKKPFVKKEKKHPQGRKEIPIDWKLVEKLLQSQCQGKEIAAELRIHEDTLYARCKTDLGIHFSDWSYSFRQKGINRLRFKQYEKAMNGDNTLLVWLGKTVLKQRENDDKEFSAQDALIDTTLERAKLKAENAELRKMVNDLHESKTGNVDLQSEQETEHLVRGSSFGEDIQ